MAESSASDNENPDLDYNLNHDDDDEQETNTTQPFQPGSASTSYLLGALMELNRLKD